MFLRRLPEAQISRRLIVGGFDMLMSSDDWLLPYKSIFDGLLRSGGTLLIRTRYTFDGKKVSASYAHGNGAKNWGNSRFGRSASTAGIIAGRIGRVIPILGFVVFAADAAANGLNEAIINATFATEVEAACRATTQHGLSFNEQQTKNSQRKVAQKAGFDPRKYIWGED